jgi:hypothetical protein
MIRRKLIAIVSLLDPAKSLPRISGDDLRQIRITSVQPWFLIERV